MPVLLRDEGHRPGTASAPEYERACVEFHRIAELHGEARADRPSNATDSLQLDDPAGDILRRAAFRNRLVAGSNEERRMAFNKERSRIDSMQCQCCVI